MITTVDISLLPADLREKVLVKFATALMNTAHKMTYYEAAWLYGYRYGTIRWLVHQGRLRIVGRGMNKRITHAAMRAYINRKRKTGAPRRALKNAQQKLA